MGRGQIRAVLVAVCMALIAGAIGDASAWAEPGGGGLPTYGGIQFPPIQSAADPEAYSWRVQLGRRQTLRAVGDREAEVDYEDGSLAFAIRVEPAHDAVGTNVPTTLEVSEGDVLTVVVHHLEGSYAYPVMPGEGWTWNGDPPTVVKGPPDETEIAEARRRAEEADRAAEVTPTPTPSVTCKVPALRGLSLAGAKARLRAADCSIGPVRLAAGATPGKGEVVKQFRTAGSELAAGTPVAVKLGSPQAG